MRVWLSRRFRTMRGRLTWMIILSTLISLVVYFLLHSAIILFTENYYVSEQNRAARRMRYVRDLQSYITYHDISSEDLNMLSPWFARNGYVYLMIYEDEELIYSSNIYTADDEEGTIFRFIDPSTVGITILYPTRDEIDRSAEGSTLYGLKMSDKTLFCSVTDFSEYGYYNFANIGSLLIAILCMACILIAYMSRSMRRVTRLADDVSVIASGDMAHTVRTDRGRDEISDLARNVEEMRSSIVRTLNSEREAIDANTELITSMSHDIRTPLTVLLGYLDLMKYSSADESVREYIKAAEKTALRLKTISDDLFLYFHAFSDREVRSAMEGYDAATLVDQMLSEHILLLTEKGYRFEGDPQSLMPDEATIFTDPTRLMRIVDNLFSNISKYADRQAPITVEAALTDVLVLTFKNHIAATPSEGESTGLGLRTCKRIAESIRATFETWEENGVFCVRVTVPREPNAGI